MKTEFFHHLRNAHNDPSFSNYDSRLRRLELFKRLLKEQEKDILKALHGDLGKSDFEGHLTEIALVESEINYACKKLRQWMKPKKVRGSLAFFWSQNKVVPTPLGTVLIIAPWNYPFQLLCAPLIGALAAGNNIVLKPSEHASHMASLMSRIIPQYFSHDEVIVIEGEATETMELIDLGFDHIFFTGSTAIGKIIMEKASHHLTPVTLELGGKSPCVVMTENQLDLAVKRIAWGKSLNCGQTCVAPDYVLIKKGMRNKFVERYEFWIKKFYGDKIIESSDMGRIISLRHFERLESLIDGQDILYQAPRDKNRLKFGPVLLGFSLDSQDKVMTEEIFGPILPLGEVEDFEQSLKFISQLGKPLAAYLFSEKADEQKQFVSTVRAGGICINDVLVHLSNKYLPFGGVGPSGLGSYHGEYSFSCFSHQQAVMRRSFWWENDLRYFPSGNKLSWLKRLLPWLG